MVGIVLVSHSTKLAEGAQQLALQMVQEKVLIETAGGVDDPENPIGTDAIKIMEAIKKVYQNDDVLVLMDMGSALMNSEMAIQLLPEEIQDKIHLCAAPIVEGAIAAAIQAMLGAPISEVKAEAMQALDSKGKQLNTPKCKAQKSPVQSEQSDALSIVITVPNKHGLHARPASKMIQLMQGLDLEVFISTDDQTWINAKSINNLSLLGAKKGDILHFRMSGNDTLSFKEKLIQFQTENFGDNDDSEKEQETKVILTTKKAIQGVPSSPGIALAKSFELKDNEIIIHAIKTDNPNLEKEKIIDSLVQAKKELERNKRHAYNSLPKDKVEIFDAHLSFLEDIELKSKIFSTIENEKQTAESAWFKETEQLKKQYEQNANQYIQQRAIDVRDIQQLVLRKLGLMPSKSWDFSESVILLANDLTPSDTLNLDTHFVKGFLLRKGNENSHTAILARSLGIPAITGLGDSIAQIPIGQNILLNGNSGQVLINENKLEWQKTLEEKSKQETTLKQLKEQASQKAISKNGISISIEANISGIREVHLANESGADGVGLFRTELYFMNHYRMPTEEMQYHLYRDIAERLDGKPLTIRTLDIGGDKPLPYLPMERENNPFLGLRGIRFTLANEPLFKSQLKAILRASRYGNLQLMFPMISSITEWEQATHILETCKQELQAKGISFDLKISCGMMVEVPSVIMLSDEFAEKVDFFSIGTNDLSQYIMAADRGNSNVKYLINDWEKSVLKAIECICKSARKYDKPVAVCGELGSKTKLIPFLLNAGVRILSMNTSKIPVIKKKIRETNIEENN